MNTLTLKAARVNRGLSVKEVADSVGVTEDTIYRYESGKSSPKISVVVKMVELYGVTISDIDFGEQ